MSKTTVEKIMSSLGLQSRPRKRFRVTTDSDHKLPLAPNLLDRKFEETVVDRFWLGDITYIPVESNRFVYLSVVMDLASREIVGWSVSDSMESELVCSALKYAVSSRGQVTGETTFHSDQGVQYASKKFRDLLTFYGMTQSMSRRGQCWDNAPMESFFSTLKTECEQIHRLENLVDARTALFDFIEIYYNREREHSSIDYEIPVRYKQAG